MAMARLRIESDGPTSRNTRIWLDDNDISHYTHGAEIKIGVNEPHRVTLHVFVESIDLGVNADVQVTTPLLRAQREQGA